MAVQSPTTQHKTFLREAIKHADLAGHKGNCPFGAVLVRNGEVISRDESSQAANHDITYHAELKLVRKAARFLERADFAECTLYSSSEPCTVCSGSFYWSGISRVVYGFRQKLLGEMEREKFAVPCADILGLAPILVTEVLETIKAINQTGTTILIVEENVKRALEISDYAYVMELGRIRMQGTAEELSKDQEVIVAYLGER